jgi:hypothetical protein
VVEEEQVIEAQVAQVVLEEVQGVLMELQIQLLGVLVLLDKDLQEVHQFIDHMPVPEVVEQVGVGGTSSEGGGGNGGMDKHIQFQELLLIMLVVVVDMDIQTLVDWTGGLGGGGNGGNPSPLSSYSRWYKYRWWRWRW